MDGDERARGDSTKETKSQSTILIIDMIRGGKCFESKKNKISSKNNQVKINQTENYSISPIQKYFKVFNRPHSIPGSICSTWKKDH